MRQTSELSVHILRARRTAASARALMASCGIALLAAGEVGSAHPAFGIAGFALILATAAVQLLVPRSDWLMVEESLSPAAGVLIVGLADQHITVLTLLWLCAVASGVLARGGRAGFLGRALLLGALTLPIVREMRLRADYATLCVATITLLLTCGRVTQELRRLLAQARHDADYDGLTGALSRSAFHRLLTQVAQAPAHDSAAAVVLFDLDDFGQINKTHGHAAGDALLTRVVDQIAALAGPDSSIGRLGGDEFALLTSTPDPAALARRILDQLERPGGGKAPVAASAGIARTPRDGRDAEALLRAADIALRVAKRSGTQQLALFAGGSLSNQGPDGARGALERLIAGEGLTMAVQPIYELPGHTVHAFEALARFGVKSNDSPLHWFALADELGLRDELELACLRAALGLLRARPANALLSVNLSAPVLLDTRTQTQLEQLPTLEGLIIEITEQALIENGAALQGVVAPLLARGVRFAVDDVGAGYSGLRQITTLHPSYLKLDRSLIHDIDSDPDRAALISALLGYAEHTGGHLVAEGVETAAELATLCELGVTLVQGYYLGRPGPPWVGVDRDTPAPREQAARVSGEPAQAVAAG